MVGITTQGARETGQNMFAVTSRPPGHLFNVYQETGFYFTFIYGGQNMNVRSLEQELKTNAYPGRGIVIGETGDGRYAVTAYFIMGRSANSRNRVFVTEGEGIRTQAFDPEKLEDPSLIIYARSVCWAIKPL